MELTEIEQAIQERLAYLQKRHDEGFERPSFDAWLDCYNALTQVRQAQASERIANRLDGWNKSGVPVENVH